MEDFTKDLVAATSNLKVGNPFDEDTFVGAVINEDHGNKIMKYINSAVVEVNHLSSLTSIGEEFNIKF